MKKLTAAVTALLLAASLSVAATTPTPAVEPDGKTVGTASISGTLTGSGTAGATFDVQVYSSVGSFHTTGNPDGTFTVAGIPAGTDFGLYFDGRRTDGTSFSQSWGQSAVNPYGNPRFSLADGEKKTHTDEFVYRTTTLAVPVNCDGCDQAPFWLQLTVFDPATGTWVDPYAYRIAIIDNVETFSEIYPGTYEVTVNYTGAAGYEQPSPARIDVTEGVPASLPFTLVRTGTSAPGVSPAVSAFINALYADIVNRRPAASEVQGWAKKLARTHDRAIVAEGFVDSDEYRLMRINSAYRTILGRPAEPGGPEGWLDGMHRGLLSTDDVEKNFMVSDEFYNRSGTTFEDWVDGLYEQILGRSASAQEQFFWFDMASRRANVGVTYDYWITHPGYHPPLDRVWVVDGIYNALEAARTRVTSMYSHYFGRTPDEAGVANWAQLDLAAGDSAVRSGLTASDEYYALAGVRYPAG